MAFLGAILRPGLVVTSLGTAGSCDVQERDGNVRRVDHRLGGCRSDPTLVKAFTTNLDNRIRDWGATNQCQDLSKFRQTLRGECLSLITKKG